MAKIVLKIFMNNKESLKEIDANAMEECKAIVRVKENCTSFYYNGN